MKHEFSPQIFGKIKSSNTKFHQNPCSGCKVVSYGQTDEHDEAKLFAILRTRLKTEVFLVELEGL